MTYQRGLIFSSLKEVYCVRENDFSRPRNPSPYYGE
jgi:hypothetical protein